MLVPYTKDGKSIKGTLIYSGQTDVWWDEQKTVEVNQERVFIDEAGDEVMESDLVWKEEN
jgi:hypothetical protein